ncbi:MAG TPA: HAD family hydrolase [Candidatus Dormibacteraeota bacterium]|nr:HAD family hydrolase [Candidatus Dormibacteraeota bacterium]
MSKQNGAITVFLDRDGVINRRRPDHVKSWEEFEFLPRSLEALARLHRMQARVIVITNQAVVGRGLIANEELIRIHSRMSEEVANSGGRIERIYACPHTPETGCACRKPGTGLLTRASAELGIALHHSFMVGDSESDVLAGRAVGSQPVLIRDDGLDGAQPGLPVVRDLTEAVQVIAEAMTKADVRPC